jgi:predicted transcriptional regulator
LQPVNLIIAAKWFYPREESLARELDIRLIRLPWTITVTSAKDHPQSGMRITSEKSWKIVSRLLKERNTSIRQLALKENVSYGWAHKVIGMLIEQNVVKKENNYVHLADLKNLLNGVAWERPLKNLQSGDEIRLSFNGAFSAAQQITSILKSQKVPFAFTSYTSGGLYTGYAFRQDAVYLYLEKNQIKQFKEQFGSDTQSDTGIRAVIYIPDRDVFSNIQEKESVVVTSPSQTLLDLAGLGYSAMDLTKVMVEKYVDL